MMTISWMREWVLTESARVCTMIHRRMKRVGETGCSAAGCTPSVQYCKLDSGFDILYVYTMRFNNISPTSHNGRDLYRCLLKWCWLGGSIVLIYVELWARYNNPDYSLNILRTHHWSLDPVSNVGYKQQQHEVAEHFIQQHLVWLKFVNLEWKVRYIPVNSLVWQHVVVW